MFYDSQILDFNETAFVERIITKNFGKFLVSFEEMVGNFDADSFKRENEEQICIIDH